MKHLLTARERSRLWIRLGIRALVITGALLILFLVVPPLCGLLMPFLIALVVAWALHPPVRWLQKKLGISRKVISMVLILLVYLGAGGALYGLLWAGFSQVRSLVENWADIRASALGVLDSLGKYVKDFYDLLPESLGGSLEDLSAKLMEWVQNIIPAALNVTVGGGMGFVSRIPSFVVAAVVFMMASYFITADYPRIRFLVTDRMPEPIHDFFSDFRRIFVEAFGGYIKSQLILSLGVFAILTVGFLIMGQPYGLLLALLLSVLDFIPIVGAGTIMVPWAVICVVTGEYITAVALMVIWGIICLFRRVAEPKILGAQTGLSPILSLVGIYVGMKAGGVLGMILGPLLLLVVINLWKLGTFDPVLRDIKMAFEDVLALLGGEEEK